MLQNRTIHYIHMCIYMGRLFSPQAHLLMGQSGYVPKNPRDVGFILLRVLHATGRKGACELLWCTSSVELPSTFT